MLSALIATAIPLSLDVSGAIDSLKNMVSEDVRILGDDPVFWVCLIVVPMIMIEVWAYMTRDPWE